MIFHFDFTLRSNSVEIMTKYFNLSDLDDPVVFVNDEVGESNHALIEEREKLRLACFVNGNPVPGIAISKEANESGILQRNTSSWLNHTINTSQCSDMGTYKCTGTSTVFTKRDKTFEINVTCKSIMISYFLK